MNPKVAQPSPRPRTPPWHAFYAIVILGLFGAISLGWFGVGQRVGDGTGFYVMCFAWAENFTPYSTERVGQKFVDYVKPRPDWMGQQHYSRGWPIRNDGTADEDHFWLYSMAAAVFYWPLKVLGADVGLCFNCLHLVLLYVTVVLIHRQLGPAAACSVVILAVGSPLLWYANKAHTELFTVVLGALGTAYLVAGRHTPSALCFALVATQNPAFGLVTPLVLAMGLVCRGWKDILAQWKLLVVVAAVLAMHPVYYWLRKGAPSPLLAGPELVMHSYFLPLRHMAAFWIDPDIGLLATWPLGLPLLVAAVVMFVRHRSRRRIEYAAFCVLSSLLLTWTYARLPAGFGGGGTVDLSRYSVWLICLFFPVLWRVLVWLGHRPRPLQRAVAIAGLALIGFSAWLYRPWLDEASRRPTAVSNWLYANLSGCYDPLPRIFYYSRGGRREFSSDEKFFWSDWAVSDASGNKILVWREAFQRQSPEAPAAVVGRGCLDPKAVYLIAQEQFTRHAGAEFCYINHRGRELFGPLSLPVGRDTPLDSQGQAERFLACGWFAPEQNGTWSNGNRAELIFLPTGVEVGKTYAIHLHVAAVAGAGTRPRILEPALTGAELGPVELLGPATLHWIVRGEKLQGPTTLSLAIRDPVSPRQLRLGSDPRPLGVKIASLQIQALPPPPAVSLGHDTRQQGQSAAQQQRGRQEEPATEHPPADSGQQAQKR